MKQLVAAGALVLGGFVGGGARASEIPVELAAAPASAVAVEWVHAQATARGIAVSGRLHQGAGRATRAGVWVRVASAGAARTVRSSAFATGGAGASFAVLLPPQAGPISLRVDSAR